MFGLPLPLPGLPLPLPLPGLPLPLPGLPLPQSIIQNKKPASLRVFRVVD